MPDFADILRDVADEEIYNLNDEASTEDILRMSQDLQKDAMRALAQFAIKLAKEKTDD